MDAAQTTFLEPFGRAAWEYEFVRTDIDGQVNGRSHPNDPSRLQLGAGFNFFGGESLSGTFEYQRSLLDEDFVGESANATLRLRF